MFNHGLCSFCSYLSLFFVPFLCTHNCVVKSAHAKDIRPSDVGIQIGKSMVFLQQDVFDSLERERMVEMDSSVIQIQNVARGFLAKRQVKVLREAGAKDKARRDAEAKERARKDAEATERARKNAEAKERAQKDAEAKERARKDAEAKERARKDAEAKERAQMDAEAKERAQRDAEARRKLEENNMRKDEEKERKELEKRNIEVGKAVADKARAFQRKKEEKERKEVTEESKHGASAKALLTDEDTPPLETEENGAAKRDPLGESETGETENTLEVQEKVGSPPNMNKSLRSQFATIGLSRSKYEVVEEDSRWEKDNNQSFTGSKDPFTSHKSFRRPHLGFRKALSKMRSIKMSTKSKSSANFSASKVTSRGNSLPTTVEDNEDADTNRKSIASSVSFTLPPLHMGEYDVEVPLTSAGFMINVGEIQGQVAFVSYRTFPDGSLGPAQKNGLVRNPGDKIIAINGTNTSRKNFREVVMVLAESRARGVAHIRFQESKFAYPGMRIQVYPLGSQ